MITDPCALTYLMAFTVDITKVVKIPKFGHLQHSMGFMCSPKLYSRWRWHVSCVEPQTANEWLFSPTPKFYLTLIAFVLVGEITEIILRVTFYSKMGHKVDIFASCLQFMNGLTFCCDASYTSTCRLRPVTSSIFSMFSQHPSIGQPLGFLFWPFFFFFLIKKISSYSLLKVNLFVE